MAQAVLTDLTGPNSFQGFKSMVSRQLPASANLYWVRFRNPPKIFDKIGWSHGKKAFSNGFDSGPGSDQSRLLTYYATDVTVPSRQLTTGDAKQIGAMYRYATGTSFSEISIQFILPRTMFTRMLFERWMNYTANDASQKVAFYDDYVCSHLDIFKYERGGVKPTPTDWDNYKSVLSPKWKYKTQQEYDNQSVKWNRLSGVWVLKNAYPFNISNINLNSSPNGLLTMDVSFYFERYRFYYPKTNEQNIGDISIPVSLGSSGSAVASNTLASNLANAATGQAPTIIAGAGGATVIN